MTVLDTTALPIIELTML